MLQFCHAAGVERVVLCHSSYVCLVLHMIIAVHGHVPACVHASKSQQRVIFILDLHKCCSLSELVHVYSVQSANNCGGECKQIQW